MLPAAPIHLTMKHRSLGGPNDTIGAKNETSYDRRACGFLDNDKPVCRRCNGASCTGQSGWRAQSPGRQRRYPVVASGRGSRGCHHRCRGIIWRQQLNADGCCLWHGLTLKGLFLAGSRKRIAGAAFCGVPNRPASFCANCGSRRHSQ
jgi:hypothetical protein